MSNSEKHKEILEAAGLPDTFLNKTADQFTADEIDTYVIAYGEESFIERSKLDRKYKTLSDLDKEIEEKQKQNGTGPVSRSEFDEIQKKVGEGKIPFSRIDDKIAQAKEFGWKEE